MKVQKVMTRALGTCTPEDSLACAVGVMWEKDCGAVPIVSNGRPVGIVTDRDAAVAAGTRNEIASEIRLESLIRGPLITCKENDGLEKALKTMGKHRVRRLPVVDKKGNLTGLISMSDMINASGANGGKDLKKRTYKALLKISRPNPIVLFETTEST